GKNQLQSPAFADQSRQALRSAATRKQSQFNFRLTKLRMLTGQPDGTSHRGFAAAPQSETVDGRNHWFAKVLNQIKNVLSVTARLFCLNSADRSELADVCTGDECFISRTCQDDAAYRFVIACIFKRDLQVVPGSVVQSVQHLRTIQRHISDVVLLLV